MRIGIGGTRRGLFALVLALGLVMGASAAEPMTPNLRILVGFSPGGGSDSVARILAPRLGELLRQTVIIDNKPGAGGNIATDLLMKAAPDGNTIMLGTIGSLAVTQHLTRLNYNPVTDLEYLTLAVSFSNVLVVPERSTIQNLDDYLRIARQDQTHLSFGSSGIGSAGHLAGELLKSMAGLKSEHVAYRGGAPAMNDLLAGVLPSIFAAPSDALQHIQSGRLRPLATSGRRRLEALPTVPTLAESGFPSFEAVNWYAFAAPLKTPADTLRRLQSALAEALSDPGVAAQLRKLGMEPAPTSAAEAAQHVRSESDKWGGVIRKAQIKAGGT